MEKKITKKPLNLRKVRDLAWQENANWDLIEEVTGYHRTTIQRKLKKEWYTTDAGYQRFLKKVRENDKHQKEISKLIPTVPSVEENLVIVCETGYLMHKGIQGILAGNVEVIIPRFCVNELEKLARTYSSAEEVLNVIRSSDDITILNLKEETLFEDPTFKAKDRTLGIVAVCCHLYCKDFKVRLLTTSYEVARLAQAQDFPPEAVTVELIQPGAK